MGNMTPRLILQLGFWSGILAFLATVAYDVVQMLEIYGLVTDPLSKGLRP